MTGHDGIRPQVVVMGVSAAGTSTVGRLIADRIGVDFLDADDLHPAANRAKMSAGTPLNDADRSPWLDRVAAELAARSGSGVVIACSALRRVYRDRIRLGAPAARFVHLHGSDELLAERAVARQDHFMPSSLLASQIATLELLDAEEGGVVLDVEPPAVAVARAAVEWLGTRLPRHAGGWEELWTTNCPPTSRSGYASAAVLRPSMTSPNSRG